MSGELIGGCRRIRLAVRGDDRGSLVAIERMRDVPFDIRRVYYLFGTVPGIDRGFHAHKQLRQLAIAVSGACTMTLDDGRDRLELRLEDPTLGLLITPGIWREMSDFTADCVLLVLADSEYDETDYIRDYDTFRQLARQPAR